MSTPSTQKRPDGHSKVVAVAGGSGGLGQHIVEGIAQRGNVTLLLLLRKENEKLVSHLRSLLPNGSPDSLIKSSVVMLDLKPGSVEKLSEIFKSHLIDTIISCVYAPGPNATEDAQECLLRAGEAVESVRRFAPADWAYGLEGPGIPHLYEPKRAILGPLRASPLSYTRFACGVFMNYLAHNSPADKVASKDPSKSGPLGHLKSFPFVIDIGAGTGSIPRPDGPTNIPAPKTTMTRVEDVGRLVAASLDLDTWEDGTGTMVGESVGYDTVSKWAGEITGKEIKITQLSSSEISSNIDPSSSNVMHTFYQEVVLACSRGEAHLVDNLQASLEAAGIQITGGKIKGVRESLEEWWGTA